jgi:hypothetical protein
MWNKKIPNISKLRTVECEYDYYDIDGYADISDDLECKKIENYDRFMDSHIDYLAIFNSHVLMFRQILKKIFSLNKNK